MFRSIKGVQPQTPQHQEAYSTWLDQTADREAARIDRIHGAVGVIPSPLWVVLVFISGVIFVFMLFFADRSEGAVTQTLLTALARNDIQRSTNYVLGVVLFAMSLFFAGMSTKLAAPTARKTMLVAGCLVFSGAAAWIATSPVSVSV